LVQAVGVVYGAMGKKTSRPGDWYCPNCNDLQFSRNQTQCCRKFGTPIPKSRESGGPPPLRGSGGGVKMSARVSSPAWVGNARKSRHRARATFRLASASAKSSPVDCLPSLSALAETLTRLAEEENEHTSTTKSELPSGNDLLQEDGRNSKATNDPEPHRRKTQERVLSADDVQRAMKRLEGHKGSMVPSGAHQFIVAQKTYASSLERLFARTVLQAIDLDTKILAVLDNLHTIERAADACQFLEDAIIGLLRSHAKNWRAYIYKLLKRLDAQLVEAARSGSEGADGLQVPRTSDAESKSRCEVSQSSGEPSRDVDDLVNSLPSILRLSETLTMLAHGSSIQSEYLPSSDDLPQEEDRKNIATAR